jgi:hypothetical protein
MLGGALVAEDRGGTAGQHGCHSVPERGQLGAAERKDASMDGV